MQSRAALVTCPDPRATPYWHNLEQNAKEHLCGRYRCQRVNLQNRLHTPSTWKPQRRQFYVYTVPNEA